MEQLELTLGAGRVSVCGAEGTLLTGHLQSRHSEINFSSICLCPLKEGLKLPLEEAITVIARCCGPSYHSYLSSNHLGTQKRKSDRVCVGAVFLPTDFTLCLLEIKENVFFEEPDSLMCVSCDLRVSKNGLCVFDSGLFSILRCCFTCVQI